MPAPVSPEATPRIGHHPWASVALFLSGVLLWGPVVLAIFVISSTRFSPVGMAGLAAVVLANNLVDLALVASMGALVLLGVYACIQQPWKGRVSTFFLLQLISLVIVMGVAVKEGVSVIQPVERAVGYVVDRWRAWRDPLPQFKRALGEPIDGDRSRHSSDVAAARKMFASSASLRERLFYNDHVLCEAAGYTDPKGLEFLLKEVWPDPH
ncbi:MAG: hypothetical protein QM586_06475 [Xenophilus sp.]